MKNQTAHEQEKPQRPGAPTTEQWEALYEVARSIRHLAPWDFMWESDLTTILLPDREEPVYCSVMGRIGEYFAVAVYPGYEAIGSYFRLSKSAVAEPTFARFFEQECLLCNFGSREEVAPEDREVYKALNLKFRGRNEWVYFRAASPGNLPWHINADQAGLLIQALQNFAMACAYIQNEKLEVDFAGGETLLRYYNPGKKLWFNLAAKMPPIPVISAKLIIDDQLMVARLKKLKRNGRRLELEVTYLPMPIQEHKDDVPHLPCMALIVDGDRNMLINQHISDTNDGIEADILNMLTQYMEQFGKPASINVRDDRAGRYIEDLCKKIGVKLIEDGVPAVDRLLEDIIGQIG